MKVYDLDYVESSLIPSILSTKSKISPFLSNITSRTMTTTNLSTTQNKANEEEEEDIQLSINNNKKKSTIPISPRITKPFPSHVPQPIRIEQVTHFYHLIQLSLNSSIKRVTHFYHFIRKWM